MSFLSFLFPGREEDVPTEEPAIKKGPDFPELYNGMTLDVITTENRPLITGKLTAFNTGELTIERLPGCLSFPVFNVGKDVGVRGYNRKMQPFFMRAVIQESTRISCKLKDLRVEPFVEERHNFRLPVNTPAFLYYQSDEHYDNPEECVLVNISTGGACFQSEFLHAEGEVLRMRVKIEDYKSMDFLGEVIRVYECEPGQFQYGFLFAQLEEEELTELTRTLYNIQVGNRREWRRTDVGHW